MYWLNILWKTHLMFFIFDEWAFKLNGPKVFHHCYDSELNRLQMTTEKKEKQLGPYQLQQKTMHGSLLWLCSLKPSCNNFQYIFLFVFNWIMFACCKIGFYHSNKHAEPLKPIVISGMSGLSLRISEPCQSGDCIAAKTAQWQDLFSITHYFICSFGWVNLFKNIPVE